MVCNVYVWHVPWYVIVYVYVCGDLNLARGVRPQMDSQERRMSLQ